MNENNIRILEETLEAFDNLEYESPNGNTVSVGLDYAEQEDSKVYLPNDVYKLNLPNSGPFSCKFDCWNGDSFSSARKLAVNGYLPLVLNMASAKNPGGGVYNGSVSQEEDLCRKSSLLLSLETGESAKFYDFNRAHKNMMNTDAVILSPTVEIIRGNNNEFLDKPVKVGVISMAAPNLHNGLGNKTQQQYEELFYERILGLFKVAYHSGFKTLVLGAWGCGVFKNDPIVVSNLFKKVIEENNISQLFENIVFSVLGRSGDSNFIAFQRNFGGK